MVAVIKRRLLGAGEKLERKKESSAELIAV